MSQFNLDKIIFSLFKDKKGFYIESGASHPIDQSNTYFLESNGWKGMLIEPRTDHNVEYSMYRPNSIVENYALVGDNHNEDTISAYSGDVGHMYNVTGIHGTELLKYNNNIKINKVEWKASTLNSILRRHQIKNVDFFSLDVEGYEHDVISGIYFEYVKFEVILIETHDYSWCDKTDDFSYLENYNYYLYNRPTDSHQIWINKDFIFTEE